MLRWPVLLCAFLVGCGAITKPATGTGGGGGATPDGGGGGGGGGATGGGTGAFVFGSVALLFTSGAGEVVGVGARAGETWVVTRYGQYAHSTGGAFTALAGVSTRTSFGLYLAPDGAVFVGQAGSATRCLSNCTSPSNFVISS